MKYYISPAIFNIYAPKANEWHSATYEQDGEFLKMTAIFSTSPPSVIYTGLVELNEREYGILMRNCKNLLPNHEEVPDIKPAA